MSGTELAITGATIVDPAAGTTSLHNLYICGDRFVEPPSEPARAHATLDGVGLYAIPGLIDMHVHMTSDPFGRTASSWAEMTPTTMTLSAVDNLSTALRHGITTVRDLGARAELGYAVRAAWRRGLFVGARPVVAGPVITSIGGHGSWEGVESEGIGSIATLVRRNVAKGSEVIKLMMGSAARSIELRPQEVAEGVEEAHWQGVPVAIHANFSERSIDTAVSAGCDTLEHGFAISAETAAKMAAQGTALCATTVALQSIVDHADTWRRRTGPALADRAVRQLPAAREGFERAIAAGVALVAGTDAGVTTVGFDSLARELETMVRWGATAQQALAAATIQAATALRRDDLGRLGAGAVADVVLLRANPLVDVGAVAQVEAVVQDGVVVRIDAPARLSGREVADQPGTVLPKRSSAPGDAPR